MHNIPGIPVGRFAIRPGPMMAAVRHLTRSWSRAAAATAPCRTTASTHGGGEPRDRPRCSRSSRAASTRWTPPWYRSPRSRPATPSTSSRRMHPARHRAHLQEAGAGHDRAPHRAGREQRRAGFGAKAPRALQPRYPATVNSRKRPTFMTRRGRVGRERQPRPDARRHGQRGLLLDALKRPGAASGSATATAPGYGPQPGLRLQRRGEHEAQDLAFMAEPVGRGRGDHDRLRVDHLAHDAAGAVRRAAMSIGLRPSCSPVILLQAAEEHVRGRCRSRSAQRRASRGACRRTGRASRSWRRPGPASRRAPNSG